MEVDGVLPGDDVLDGRSSLLFASHFDKFGPYESKRTRLRITSGRRGRKEDRKMIGRFSGRSLEKLKG